MQNQILRKLINKEHLSPKEIENFICKIEKDEVDDLTLSAFIVGVTSKGIEKSELISLVKAIQNHSESYTDIFENAIACSGTGADNQNTFNITTASALVAAASGVKIVKKISSDINKKSNNKSFVKELGINTCQSLESAKEQFLKNNIVLIDSKYFNNVENKIQKIRKELNITSVFNITDAIIQPVKTKKIFIGNAFPELTDAIIETLKILNYERALVVNAQNPLLDEISICSETTIVELNNNKVEKYEITPDSFGIKRADIHSLRGATPKYNANLVLDIFNGKIKDAKLDTIAMNAGAIIYLSGQARNYLEGIMKAYTTIGKGFALEKINNLLN